MAVLGRLMACVGAGLSAPAGAAVPTSWPGGSVRSWSGVKDDRRVYLPLRNTRGTKLARAWPARAEATSASWCVASTW